MGKDSIKTVGPEKSIVIFNRQKDWNAISLPVIALSRGPRDAKVKNQLLNFG